MKHGHPHQPHPPEPAHPVLPETDREFAQVPDAGEPVRILGRLKIFILSRWILFGCFVLITFLLTALDTLQKDGADIFEEQKGALTLDVFARTDLKPEAYQLIEEKLRAIHGVKEVIATSPEEALKRIGSESELALDAKWLAKKSEEMKGKGTLLPWSYTLHLARWDEPFLADLVQSVKDVEVGYPRQRAVSEVHYDKERWSLAFALYNYVQWVSNILWVSTLFIFSFLAVFLVRWVKAGSDRVRLFRDLWIIVLLGALSGLLSHGVYLLVLSSSFFPDSFSWKMHFGHFLPQQMLLCTLLVLMGYGHRPFTDRTG